MGVCKFLKQKEPDVTYNMLSETNLEGHDCCGELSHWVCIIRKRTQHLVHVRGNLATGFKLLR